MHPTLRFNLFVQTTLLSLTAVLIGGCTKTVPGFSVTRPPQCPADQQISVESLTKVAHYGDTTVKEYLALHAPSYRESIRKLDSVDKLTVHNPTQERERLFHERGDRFPSIHLFDSNGSVTSLRLDPPLRKHDVTRIHKIAVTPNEARVAVIVSSHDVPSPWVMLIDKTGHLEEALNTAAYDLLWVDNKTLLVSTGKPQPDTVFLLHQDGTKRELIHTSTPGAALTLSKDPAGDFFSVKERSSSINTLTLFKTQSPKQPLLSISSPSSGNHCVSFQDNVACISLATNPFGDLIIFKADTPRQTTVLTRGTRRAPLFDIDSDEKNLVVFSRALDRSALQVYTSTTGQPETIVAPTALATFSSAPKTGIHKSIKITLQSPLSRRKRISVSNLKSLSDDQTEQNSVCPQCETKTLYSTSSDGTRVPISIIAPPRPEGMVIIAYGAYGVSLTPSYQRELAALLADKIAVAFVHVRGGGERGEPWHKAGSGRYKNKSIDDLKHATIYLQKNLEISKGATIGIGTSAGGWLFIQTALTNPKLFAALILNAPLIDPGTNDSNSSSQTLDMGEWPTTLSSRVSSDLTHTASAQHFPRVLASIPLQDEVIPAAHTLRWLNQLACLPERKQQDLWIIDYKGTHSVSSSSIHTRYWQALQHHFVRSIIKSYNSQELHTSP